MQVHGLALFGFGIGYLAKVRRNVLVSGTPKAAKVFDRINMIYKILRVSNIARIWCGKMLSVMSDTEAVLVQRQCVADALFTRPGPEAEPVK